METTMQMTTMQMTTMQMTTMQMTTMPMTTMQITKVKEFLLIQILKPLTLRVLSTSTAA
jgi:hypothetical protein